MMYKTIIQEAAYEDFKDAQLWYKSTKVNGLSQRFSKAIKKAIKELQKQPTIYAIRYKNVRIVHAEKFPYVIHYFIDENLIVITAIIYGGRDPNITLDRLT